MLNLVLFILGVVAIFVVIVVVFGRRLLRGAERSVAGHFDALDFIISTGIAPPAWSARHHKTLARMRDGGAPDAELERYRAAAKKRLIARLQRLERQMSRSTVLGSDGASVVNSLRFVRNSWTERSYDDFAPPGA